MILETSDGPWLILMHGGKLLKRRPWCDCRKVAFGFKQRHDGTWVRPCCMRRERAAYERLGDGPVQHNPLTCNFCRSSTRKA